ncbi:unnamed protein product [Prorocentrum cordatum]|uniref:Uncharacterized protein n=1 Tax=Prorocentrum cordatum TaxID=2364126 RepID=A0ABN9UUD4_9DINO|nr:unnamed protein product [Polarella glacialis]
MPQVSLQLQDRDGKSVLYPLTPEEYTLKSLEEVPNTGDSESVNEFPVLGTSKAKAPEVQSRCEPGFGVMDVPGRKWVLGDTFLRRYYSILLLIVVLPSSPCRVVTDAHSELLGYRRTPFPSSLSVSRCPRSPRRTLLLSCKHFLSDWSSRYDLQTEDADFSCLLAYASSTCCSGWFESSRSARPGMYRFCVRI